MIYRYALAVTTSDTVNYPTRDLEFLADALYVGTSAPSDVVLVLEDDSTVTLKNVIAGTIYPIRHKRVNATNTTASNLVRLYR